MKKVTKWSLSLIAVVCVSIASASVFAGKGRGMHHRLQDHFNKVDINGDEMISRQEQLDFSAKRFDTADINGDGMLTKEEIKQTFMQHRKEKIKQSEQDS